MARPNRPLQPGHILQSYQHLIILLLLWKNSYIKTLAINILYIFGVRKKLVVHRLFFCFFGRPFKIKFFVFCFGTFRLFEGICLLAICFCLFRFVKSLFFDPLHAADPLSAVAVRIFGVGDEFVFLQFQYFASDEGIVFCIAFGNSAFHCPTQSTSINQAFGNSTFLSLCWWYFA